MLLNYYRPNSSYFWNCLAAGDKNEWLTYVQFKANFYFQS